MTFKDYIKSGKVIAGSPDVQKSKALIKMSKNNLKIIKQISLNEDSASIILSSAYESLRQILESICLIKGYKVYSHEAYTDYLKELNENNISMKFDRLRKLRNGINYYGKSVPKEVTNQALKDINECCLILIKKYLNHI